MERGEKTILAVLNVGENGEDGEESRRREIGMDWRILV